MECRFPRRTIGDSLAISSGRTELPLEAFATLGTLITGILTVGMAELAVVDLFDERDESIGVLPTPFPSFD